MAGCGRMQVKEDLPISFAKPFATIGTKQLLVVIPNLEQILGLLDLERETHLDCRRTKEWRQDFGFLLGHAAAGSSW